MKKNETKTYIFSETCKKIIPSGILCCLAAFALPLTAKAEESMETFLNAPSQTAMPEYSGKLAAPQNSAPAEQNGQAQPNSQVQRNYQVQQNAQNSMQKSMNSYTMTTPNYPESSVSVTEDGSNLYVLKGSRLHDDYSNSYNHNNGFYMNITNPDGSAMSFGSYFNSNSTVNGPRRRSHSQIITDKIE